MCCAGLVSYQTTCWLCGTPVVPPASSLETSAPSVERSQAAAPRPDAGVSYSLSTLMLITTLVAVCCGLFVAAPGLGVGVCILLVPVLVRTAMVVSRREEAGLPVSAGEKIGLVIGSFVVTTVVLTVVAVAAVGTFCAVCLTARTEAAIPFALLIGGGAGIAILVLMIRWVRHRYRRDVAGGATKQP